MYLKLQKLPVVLSVPFSLQLLKVTSIYWVRLKKQQILETPTILIASFKQVMTNLCALFVTFLTGLLIFCHVAISHNWPQIATFHIIHQKLHNSSKEWRNLCFLLKFYDNLNVVSTWFTSQKTLEIIRIVHEHSINKTGVLWVVLHVRDLVLVLSYW